MTEEEQAKTQRWAEIGKKLYEHSMEITAALAKILYKKEDSK